MLINDDDLINIASFAVYEDIDDKGENVVGCADTLDAAKDIYYSILNTKLYTDNIHYTLRLYDFEKDCNIIDYDNYNDRT